MIKTRSSIIFARYLFIFLGCWHIHTFADGTAVDKIYHPYVNPDEYELAWRAVSQRDNNKEFDDRQLHKFSFGKSMSDTVFAELYLLGEKNPDESFNFVAYELEVKLQLTEQGEYDADWGLLFELEKLRDHDTWEAKTALITTRQWGRWLGTANVFLIYEWGDELDDELESKLSLQARYRYSRRFEPAIEFYGGQDSRGLGPTIMGTERFGGAKKLHWELGYIFGINSSPDQVFRALLEYEF